MTLQYLDFDYSEDAHGHGSFEAMASVPAARLVALQAEIARVLDWAVATFPGQRAPLEEGESGITCWRDSRNGVRLRS